MAHNGNTRIYVTGPSGSGKTTVGNILAEKLGWKWLDLDQEIERVEQTSIASIFERGETYFRLAESRALYATANHSNIVVSVGGGAVISEENRDFIANNGVSIALMADPLVLYARIKDQSEHRPLLRNGGLAAVQQQFANRKAYYQQMDTMIETDHNSPQMVADAILGKLIARGALDRSESSLRIVRVQTASGSYPIYIQRGILRRSAEIIFSELQLPHRCVLICDEHTHALYAESLKTLFQEHNCDTQIVVTPSGESNKTLQTVEKIYQDLLSRKHERSEAIIALGGGVIGDMAGFTAATYVRGTPLIHIPTTLLAQVDSSIGGKTGVNFGAFKNMIGSFYQPRAVIIDPDLLLTLPERIYNEGFGEIVKCAMIGDKPLFETLENGHENCANKNSRLLEQVIGDTVAFKAAIVSADEREADVRMALNYGHTIGHALESVTEFSALLHGEAVFAGMEIEGNIAVQIGLLAPEQLARQNQLIAHIRRFEHKALIQNIDPVKLLEAAQTDKKSKDGKVRWVLPNAIGSYTINITVPDDVALRSIQMVQK